MVHTLLQRCIPVQDKLKTDRQNSTRKIIRFNDELLSLINDKRGSMPFGTWVQDVCKVAVHTVGTDHNKIGTDRKSKSAKVVQTEIKPSIKGLPSNISSELHLEIITLKASGLSNRAIGEKVGVSKDSVARALKVIAV
jgi:hypothetical protein